MSEPSQPDPGRGESSPPPPEQMRHQQISARVPEHVSRGVFSTGALVITGANEFVLDFVLRAMRPHQIVARVVLPHPVMPQLLRVLGENIQRYEQRFGAIPSLSALQSATGPQPNTPKGEAPASSVPGDVPPEASPAPPLSSTSEPGPAAPGPVTPGGGDVGASPPAASEPAPPLNEQIVSPAQPPQVPHEPDVSGSGGPAAGASPAPAQPRRPSVEEVYSDLKLPDEILSGVYANAVMISHLPGMFSFDFITSFYPRSAVSSRVFLPATHVPPLLDSMKNIWHHLQLKHQQLRQRRDQGQ